jgi:DTW domain-containing protein YfiP
MAGALIGGFMVDALLDLVRVSKALKALHLDRQDRGFGRAAARRDGIDCCKPAIAKAVLRTREVERRSLNSVECAQFTPYTPGMTADPPLEIQTQQAECPRCSKLLSLCVCDGVAAIDNKISLLILQHPQEQDKTLGTARLTALHFKDATLKIGLSWASLAKALGRPADPQRWAILYLGSVRAAALDPDAEIIAVNRKGEAEDRQQAILRSLEGVVLLDGSWSQAKALWWRNPWMLKCRRIILNPSRPSRYGKLRREPRSDGLSTIESAAMLLSRLERRAEIETALLASFDRLLARYRELRQASPAFDRAERPARKKSGRAKAMHRHRERS